MVCKGNGIVLFWWWALLICKHLLLLLNRYNKAKIDLLQAQKKVQQLETRNNELNASLHQLKSDMARALEEKKVISTIYILTYKFTSLMSLQDRIGELERNLETERVRVREEIAIQLQKILDKKNLRFRELLDLVGHHQWSWSVLFSLFPDVFTKAFSLKLSRSCPGEFVRLESFLRSCVHTRFD